MEDKEIKEQFEKHIEEFGSNYCDPFNQMLFAAFDSIPKKMCEKWIIKSMLLIDRAYSANFSMSIGKAKKGTNDTNDKSKDPFDWLQGRVDLTPIYNVFKENRKKCASAKELEEMTSVVECQIETLKKALNFKKGHGPISFVSKYAFFISRSAVIYDNLATKGIKSLGFNVGNEDYRRYVCAFIKLLKVVYPDKKKFTSKEIKDLDGYLYELGRKLEQERKLEKS
ncbi:hypothetical protein [Kiloniella sp.]|uniref:hypothetical protein n=1 Tax=Kiloniella sp. TaxID=1938587 RepID=UPI003A95CA24